MSDNIPQGNSSVQADYNNRLETVKAIIAEFNKNSNSVANLSYDNFETKLREAGGVSLNALKHISWEDLVEMGLPKLLAKQVASIFRQDVIKTTSTWNINSKARHMSINELFSKYNPQEEDTVFKKLKEKAETFPTVVFTAEGRVDVEASSKILREIRDAINNGENYAPRTTYIRVVNGLAQRPCKVYLIGQTPEAFYYENPLYPGTKLRNDQTCPNTEFCWQDVADNVKQLLYLAINNTHEIKITSLEHAFTIIDLITGRSPDVIFNQLCLRYKTASALYDEMQTLENLPSLKIPRSKLSNKIKNDPFYSQHKKF